VRRNKLVAGAAVLAVGLGGTAAAAPSATYSLSADKTKLKFNKSTIRAKAGRVTLKMANPSSLPHNVGIKGRGTGKTVNAAPRPTPRGSRRAPTRSTAASARTRGR
jgi:plastocyanin